MQLPTQFGKYELQELLATGGMAEVYLARSFGTAGFEKQLVIKRILPGLATNPRFVSMFVKEAKISAGLSHPNIVQIYELGRVGDDHYIAMEYIRGHDLTRLNRRLRQMDRRLPPALAVFIATSLLRGLAYAHSATDAQGRPLNLVHRDVSPHNVMVSFQGDVKLFDFGIARLVGDTTAVGDGRPGGGKFAYMSPEQARGEPLDHRSDLYSAGLVLHHLLVGEKLYKGLDPEEKLRRIRLGAPLPAAPPSGVPAVAWQALRHLLAGAASDRPSSAEEAEEELLAALFRMGERADSGTLRAFLGELFGDEARTTRTGMDLEGLVSDLRQLEAGATRTDADELSDAGTPTRGRLAPGERKGVVVLVAEVVGLTDLSANFDAERVVRGHLKFLRRARRVVGRYGGVLDAWQDDTLVVLFGVPRAHELDVDRALACATELVRVSRGMERHGLKMSLCVGLHHGTITVGARTGRSLRYLAAGDTVKLARRLCYEADLEEVLVSDEVQQRAGHFWTFSDGPSLREKGRRRRRPSFHLHGRRRTAHRTRGQWRPRGQELDILGGALRRLGDGRSSVVSVRGAAGTGKTRLLRELRDLAKARGVPVYTGRAIPYGSHGAGTFLKELVADILNITGAEGEAELRAQLSRLAQLGLSEADRGVLHALFAVEAGGRRLGPSTSRLPRVARTVVQKLAEQQPAIVAVEDLQHLRPEEVALLAELIRGAQDHPVLFVLTGRQPLPGVLGSPDWEVALGPLSTTDQRALVTGWLASQLGDVERVCPDLMGLLAKRAQGNPLYLEAMVDALLRGERVAVDDGRARLKADEATIQLPPGLDGLIQARIDALAPGLKELLQLAAIVGTEFSASLLAASLQVDDVQPSLAVLEARGLLQRAADQTDNWRFGNLFVWEAVRQSTVDARRRDLHGMVADGLLATRPGGLGTVRETLAEHCAGAGRFVQAAEHIQAAGDDLASQQLMAEAGARWDRAVGWLGAARRSGSSDVSVHLEADLRIKAGAAWSIAGDPNRAELHLQVALELAEEGAGSEVEARAQLELGQLYRTQGRLEIARLHFEFAVSTAQGWLEAGAWAREVAVGALSGLGLLSYDIGENNAAEAVLTQARELAGSDDALLARVLHGLSLRPVREGDEAAALALLSEARQAATAADDRILLGRVINNLGIVHYGAGRYPSALECFRESLRLREGLGYRNGVAINLHNIGDVHLRVGERARAWAAFSKSHALCADASWERGVVMNEVFLAWLELEEAPNEAAFRARLGRLEAATRQARTLSDPETALTGARLHGLALVGRGDTDGAMRVLTEALAEAEDLDARPLVREIKDTLARCQEPG